MHPAAIPANELLGQCEVQRVRRSGPGGQHRNKVETGIVLRHRPTGVRSEAAERRSQEENRRVALGRLRVKLALDVRSPVERDAPSRLWQSRCTGGRIQVSVRHDDYPTLLAEALDAVHGHEMGVRPAAQFLGCTPSQLIKFLKREPRAFSQLNEQRAKLGLKRLG